MTTEVIADPIKKARSADVRCPKFALGDRETGLQKILKDKGISTVVTVGTTPHNGVLFTSVAAALRGFNSVVRVDGMSGNNAYENQAVACTLANSIVYKATLTSVDQIKCNEPLLSKRSDRSYELAG